MTVRLSENAASPGVDTLPRWLSTAGSGVVQRAYQPEACFTPLYSLRQVKALSCDDKGVMI